MSDASPRPMIRLSRLTKHYPGEARPAVDDLTLDVSEGEIVVFVGPSGCGKTTTMKLVNRLIEPTSGRIEIDGRDVSAVNPDQLRRHIGYAIQQTGLFPHRTVADNIATVPRILKWDRRRIAERVDELLEKVGLASATYRDRYPKQLSGGQQQRVGVARALATDPEVMLMDEPFGAIDPLTREALQDEFLRLQSEMRKTIVFVTHDIDEAVKMGDRIAIFGEGGRVVQYDVPDRILSDPADRFVADFIGAGAFVKRLSLTRVGDVEVATGLPTVAESADTAERRGALRSAPGGFVLLLDGDSRPVGWLGADAGHGTGVDDDAALLGRGLPLLGPLGPGNTLHDGLNAMLGANSDVVVITDGDGRYRGTLDLPTIQTLLHAPATERASATVSPASRESGLL